MTEELNKRERQKAQTDAADTICDEMVPNLFHDSDRNAWARLPVADHYETYAINSEEMANYLKREFWEAMKTILGYGITMPKNELKDRLELLTYKARFDGPEHSVFLRVGEDERVLYIDLCDRNWRAVRISPDGWEIVDQPEVFFRRAQGMKPLPTPERGGSLDELEPFINVTSDQFTLVKGFLLAASRPKGPYPLLVAIGSAGSAKSNLCRMLRALVDPNSSPLNSPPREIRDLYATAISNHVLGYDNLSQLSSSLSDSLCRFATGAGNVERRLYSNNEQVRYPQMSKPIILNGISEFITAPDLLDRSLILGLRHVGNRRTEASLWRGFDAKKGRIFGGLLDLMVQGVRNLPTVRIPRLPRMAEFVQWCVACGLEDFQERYEQNLVDSSLALLEDDPLAMAIKALTVREADWEGTAAELVPALREFGHGAANPRALSADLRRLAPALRSGLAIAVDFPRRTSDRRLIRISRI